MSQNGEEKEKLIGFTCKVSEFKKDAQAVIHLIRFLFVFSKMSAYVVALGSS
jgi:hypothetical protein